MIRNNFLKGRVFKTVVLLTLILIFSMDFLNPETTAQSKKSLWDLGYALLPEPQKIELKDDKVSFGSDWKLELLTGVNEQHIAVRTLINRLNKEFGINLSEKTNGKTIQLEIRPGIAAKGEKEALARQGYILETKSDKILIAGNDNPGIFYGVQTLLQLLSSKSEHTLPVCRIEDWPELELRIIHWCEKHHQSKMETLKRYIDQAAEYKINAIGWQIEDKFAYKRHPVIGAPGAFTKEQVQEIDKYARERYVELIPLVDCPAHIAYVLKHPEFAHLREDINNNYMMCPYNEDGWKLLYDMFDEITEAFGGKYFHVSTDEAYFLGDGIECGCADKLKQKGKSGIFVDFMNRATKYLEGKGKQVMFWGEWPLEVKDIPKLPSTIIDAVAGDESLERKGELETERKHGMRVLIYVSIHGGGLFANYFQRVNGVFKDISSGEVRKNDVLGTFVAGWDDSGPHDEVFWLGWVAGTSYAWNGETPLPEKLISQFMKLFYGINATNMEEVYKLMDNGHRFWSGSWTSVPSTLVPIYGYSEGKYPIPRPRRLQSLELPNLPDVETLYNHPFWKNHYGKNLENLRNEKEANALLIKLLNDNLNKVSKNKYNIEIILSLAQLFRHNINLLETLNMIEDTLSSAARNYLDYNNAVSCLNTAIKLAEDMCKEREESYNQLKNIWEVSRYPKGRIVNGRKFVHILDDTKNHTGDLTPDLSYIVMRERDLNLEKWIYDLKSIRHTFVRKYKFEIPEEFLHY